MEPQMAWFLNQYECHECGRPWTDTWSCMCDDDCPYCGARNNAPRDAYDLTNVIVEDGDDFIILHSPKTAERNPAYSEIARFPTAELAGKHLAEINGS